jgi:hypothetical protein
MHPLQSKKYRETQSEKMSNLNKINNRVKADRPIVHILKVKYKELNMTQPKGGLHVKNDAWLELNYEKLFGFKFIKPSFGEF